MANMGTKSNYLFSFLEFPTLSAVLQRLTFISSGGCNAHYTSAGYLISNLISNLNDHLMTAIKYQINDFEILLFKHKLQKKKMYTQLKITTTHSAHKT